MAHQPATRLMGQCGVEVQEHFALQCLKPHDDQVTFAQRFIERVLLQAPLGIP